jgi:hypothetical protein
LVPERFLFHVRAQAVPFLCCAEAELFGDLLCLHGSNVSATFDMIRTY